MKIKVNKNFILYLFTVIFFAIFYYFLAFAGDDWAWGSSIGIDRLKNAFDGYNGRYLGNLLIILITRSVTARVIICSLTVFLLIFVLSKIFDSLSSNIGSARNYVIAFSSLLLLILPNQITIGTVQPFQIFGSTIGWLSGFTNYVVPSVLILIFYFFVTGKCKEGKAIYVFLVFDGILACLCVEHYTLFCIIFSGGVILYRYYFYKKLCKKSLAFLSGSLLGAVIMFTNSSYRLMQQGDTYSNQRSVGFLNSFKKYAQYILPSNAEDRLVIFVEIMLLAVIVLVLIFFLFKVYKAFKNRNVKQFLPVICTVVMTLPLLFTNSGKEIYIVAPRCYFLQYFMLVIYFYGKFAQMGKPKDYFTAKKFKAVTSAILTVLILVTSAEYFALDYMGIKRDSAVDNALKSDSETVEIIKYPKSIEHIQWASNFIEIDEYLERYKNYKNIPEDRKTKIIEYK